MRKLREIFLKAALIAAAVITGGILLFLIGIILKRGLPQLSSLRLRQLSAFSQLSMRSIMSGGSQNVVFFFTFSSIGVLLSLPSVKRGASAGNTVPFWKPDCGFSEMC